MESKINLDKVGKKKKMRIRKKLIILIFFVHYYHYLSDLSDISL